VIVEEVKMAMYNVSDLLKSNRATVKCGFFLSTQHFILNVHNSKADV
jgi:hypothetical protein